MRLILYDFVKIPQSFFCSKKRQLPLQGSLCRTGASPVPTGCKEFSNIISAVNHHISATIQRRQQAAALPRRRLLRIARNSFWLSLTHYATPPFPQKSRSARLFGCKRPHYGSLSLPTFADCGQPQGLSYSTLLTSQRLYHRFIGQACFLNAERNST